MQIILSDDFKYELANLICGNNPLIFNPLGPKHCTWPRCPCIKEKEQINSIILLIENLLKHK